MSIVFEFAGNVYVKQRQLLKMLLKSEHLFWHCWSGTGCAVNKDFAFPNSSSTAGY